MEKLLLTIDVKCLESISVQGHNQTVVMIPFNGNASGEYFSGKIIGTGVDTQKYKKDGINSLSARYTIEGIDFKGQNCKIFIENNVSDDSWTPTITTDSIALKDWETAALRSTIDGTKDGVIVKIFAK